MMNRRYDFDWLRVFGAVMVIVAHCATSFSPWIQAQTQGAFSFGNLQPSKLFSELLWNLNLWLMPLFMLLAGASVWFTLGKRSNRQYLCKRWQHVGLPFIILMLSFIVPMTYGMRSSMGQFNGSLQEFYLHFFEGIAPTGNFALFHLWFLLYLLIYALLTLPLFRFLQGAVGRRLIDRLASACQRPGGIYLFALPLLVVQLALSGVAPQPEFPALVNDGTRFASLLLVFIFGYILNSDVRFRTAVAQQWHLATVVALATSAVLFGVAWPDTFNPYRDLPQDYSLQYVAFWTVFALSSWSWLITWLGFGQRFLNVNHPLLKGVNALSYPLYLLHPLVWGPGVFLVAQWQADAFIAFLMLTAIVLVGTLVLTAILRRWRVTRLILGLKAEPAPSQSFSQRREGDANWLQRLSAIGSRSEPMTERD